MADSIFLLSSLITRNFDRQIQKKFLAKYRLMSEFERSNLHFNIFVQDYIMNGVISKEELEEFLFDDLLYGNQRHIFMYKIYSMKFDIMNSDELLRILQSYYPTVDSLNYNQILYQPHNPDITDLVGIRTTLSLNATKIQKINLIFSQQCQITNRDGTHGEYSYITIEIDLQRKLLFIKVKPKSQVLEEKAQPTELVQQYFQKIANMFGFVYADFLNVHKNTLCNMNIELYNQIYNKMVQTQPSKINEFIKDIADKTKQKLNISHYDMKVAENNIFNIEDTLTKMIEHILISNILYESSQDGNLENVDGFVTYIKFSDGTNISARLRSEHYVEPIFSSETFMSLRSSIENAKQLSELKVYWLNRFSGLRVSYNAINPQCLEILLYKHHKKEEFEYAVSQYNECEQRTIQTNYGLLQMEA